MFIKLADKTMLEALKQHDSKTYEHSIRVASLMVHFGQFLNLSKEELSELFYLGLYHDIGKLQIDQKILRKRDKLNKNEFNQIGNHGEEILMGKGFSKEFLQSVRSHHENYNGSGYPDNLVQTDIPSYASMLRIIDSFDAMTNHRFYNKTKTSQEAVCEIASLKG